MPMRWTVEHDKKLVLIVAEGPIGRQDLEAHFDALVVENALEYSKLFDARKVQPVYGDDDVMSLGARLSVYTAIQRSGPLAVIGSGAAVEEAFRRFLNVSPSKRPARLFATVEEARTWLEEVTDRVDDQRGRELGACDLRAV